MFLMAGSDFDQDDDKDNSSLYLYKGKPNDVILEYKQEGMPGDFALSTRPRVIEFYNPYCVRFASCIFLWVQTLDSTSSNSLFPWCFVDWFLF